MQQARSIGLTSSALRAHALLTSRLFNFDVQRDVSHGILLDLVYVGNNGRELPYTDGDPIAVVDYGHIREVVILEARFVRGRQSAGDAERSGIHQAERDRWQMLRGPRRCWFR